MSSADTMITALNIREEKKAVGDPLLEASVY